MTDHKSVWRRDVISWAMYDFANTIYSMNILSLYFAGWLVIDLGYRDIHYSLAHAASMLLVAALMPALGYLSDLHGREKKKLVYLAIFTGGSVLALTTLALLPQHLIIIILALFTLSNFFYEGGMVFYNALLDAVSDDETVGRVSGIGVSFGYFGSIVGMILVLPFVTGSLFGLDIPFIAGGGKEGAFLPTAVFFAIFALPIFFFVRPQTIISAKAPENAGFKNAYRDVFISLRATEKYPGLLRFLVADFFFEDAIATVIIFMAVFTERVLGLDDDGRTTFFIVSTVFAMIGAYILGLLADKFSPKKVLGLIVSGWVAMLIIFAVNSVQAVFWICGPIIGILLGGVWAVSRPLLMQLVPREKLGEFFGLFSLSGRAAAIIGPLVWGVVVYLLSADQPLGKILAKMLGLDNSAAEKMPYRIAVVALALMMVLGLIIFRKVPDRGKFHQDKML